MHVHVVLLVAVGCVSSAAPPPASAVVGAPIAPSADPVVSAKPSTVLVQLAYEGTFGIGPPFSQVPPFTLLDDGTWIGAAEFEPVNVSRLPRDQVDAIVKRVRELGFDRLQSYTDSCSPPNPKSNARMCVSDGSYSIIRVAGREVKTYAGFSNDSDAHDKIIAFLEKFEPTTPTTRYRPTRGALHVRIDEAPPKAGCPAIDPAFLARTRDHDMWGIEIAGKALDAVLALAPAKIATFVACGGGKAYHLTFLPGVPGSDLSLELGIYKRP